MDVNRPIFVPPSVSKYYQDGRLTAPILGSDKEAVQKFQHYFSGEPKVDENLHIRALGGQIDVVMPKIEH
jgi:hypothetical protein